MFQGEPPVDSYCTAVMEPNDVEKSRGARKKNRTIAGVWTSVTFLIFHDCKKICVPTSEIRL